MGDMHVPGNTLVTDMWIPGTHDTMSLYGGAFAKCQTWTLGQQLDAGIRALDIRVKYEGCGMNNLQIYHGVTYQRTNWLEVARTLQQWIAAHPTEFVLVFVKNEDGEGTCDNKDLFAYIREFTDDSKWLWKTSTAQIGTEDAPTYDDFKGKLVFMANRRQNGEVVIQDDYTDITPQDKWKLVWNHARSERNGNLYINMLSATAGGGWGTYTPAMFAYYVNKRAHDNIIQNKWKPGSEFPLALRPRSKPTPQHSYTSPRLSLSPGCKEAEFRTPLLCRSRDDGLSWPGVPFPGRSRPCMTPNLTPHPPSPVFYTLTAPSACAHRC